MMRNDCKHVALEKIRDTLNLLRKSNFGSNSSQREDSLQSRLKSLQNSLRYDQRDAVDPAAVVDPFLAILRAPYLAGPFKLVALDALQILTSCKIFAEAPDSCRQTLATVVDAVTRCKFVQTDAMGDEMVQLQIINTLRNIVRSSTSQFLSDETAWDIISSSHNILLHTAATGSVRSVVYQAAEKTIIDASCFVFANAGKREAIDSNSEVLGISESNDTDPSNHGEGPSSTCAVKVLKFFIDILQKSCDEGKAVNGGQAKRALPSATANAINIATGGNSGGNIGSQNTRHNDIIDTETRNLLFAIKAINAIFLADGNLDGSRALISNNEQLSSLVRDHLGRCLILLSSRRGLPPAVLQSALGLFSLTVQLMGPTTRIVIECFMRYIYIKAILQVRVIFASHDESMRLMMDPAQSKETATSSSNLQSLLLTTSSSASFSLDEIEIILESLADLLADLGFLPSLFASFDCDPSKSDIVQPLIKYLSSCMRYTMVCESSELRTHGIQEIGTLIQQCYSQISFTMNQRKELKAISVSSTIEKLPLIAIETSTSTTADSASLRFKEDSSDWMQLAEKLRLTRLAKGVLAEAAQKFSRKPQDGLRFLQSKGVLPTPLTPASVAKFLRIAPGLPNECTGSFLGELGKDNPSYEADGKAFHRSVLLSYVRSFELKGQTVLNCMRIFLSAFRLPGEAQQIDRILVAFSEYCHDGSIEGTSGLLENPEVTYLLTFSMIMLNTDLHNPNVRADRKMTIAQFIKNNSFYGEELNQTRNIPKDYLEAVYESLSQVPLRTERNDLNASITPEMWMDLQLQAAINTEKGHMLCTSYSPTMIRKMTKVKRLEIPTAVVATSDQPDLIAVSDQVEDTCISSQNTATDSDEIANVARHLLAESSTVEEVGLLEMSDLLHGTHWVVDKDLLSCIFNDLFGVAVSPFVMHRYVVAPSLGTVAPRATSVSYTSDHGNAGDGLEGSTQVAETNHWRVRHASVRALSTGIELSLDLLSLLHSNEMHTAVDAFIFLFVDFAGVSIKENMCYLVLKSLSLIDFEITEKVAMSKKNDADKLKAAGLKSSNRVNGDVDSGKDRAGDSMMEGLLTSIASRAALGTLLLITSRSPAYLSGQSWKVLWILLSLLRDCSLLPAKMVMLDVNNSDTDLLPPSCRLEFETRLLAARRREVDALLASERGLNTATLSVKKSSSLLSFQGLGEALFGTSLVDSATDGAPAGPLYCTVTPRWDLGYEGTERDGVEGSHSNQTSNTEISIVSKQVTSKDKRSSSEALSINSVTLTLATSNSDIILQREKSREGVSEYEDVRDVLAAFINLREMMASCGVAQLVSDTRFFTESTLGTFFESLVSATESGDGVMEPEPSVLSKINRSGSPGILLNENKAINLKLVEKKSKINTNEVENSLLLIMSSISDLQLKASSKDLVSASSVSWLENILIEASLRNRDRLCLFWNLLVQHYEMTIETAVLLTYPLERRITGLFRLSARMINRDVFTSPIIELFKLFLPSQNNRREKSEDINADIERTLNSTEDQDSITNEFQKKPVNTPSGLSLALLGDLSGQISSGIWRVLTTNLEVLPTLTLSQWQIIFDVIAVCASAGGYSSIKAFESMAWLLHESRLQGEIPMFCIVGIRPLLCNNRTTVSVSVGAIRLLTHLHSRLEVLFTNEEDYVQVDAAAVSLQSTSAIAVSDDDHESDTPLLWENCWTPILSAMAEGCADSRKPVRLAASNALCSAILDKHVKNVPVGLMVKILGDVYIAIVLRLAEYLVREMELNGSNGIRSKSNDDRLDASGDRSSSGKTKMKRKKDEKQFPTGGGDVRSTDNDLQLSKDAVGEEDLSLTVMPILCTICKVFADQIIRFSSYPSFDRLWLRLLHVFGYFLGAPYGFDHAVLLPSHRRILGNELHRTVAAAGDHLSTLINLLVNLGIFKERSGLWLVTKDSLQLMTHCPAPLLVDPSETGTDTSTLISEPNAPM